MSFKWNFCQNILNLVGKKTVKLDLTQISNLHICSRFSICPKLSLVFSLFLIEVRLRKNWLASVLYIIIFASSEKTYFSFLSFKKWKINKDYLYSDSRLIHSRANQTTRNFSSLKIVNDLLSMKQNLKFRFWI